MKPRSFRLISVLIFFAVLLSSGKSYSQIDSLELAETYYTEGMNVFDFTHRKQSKDMFLLAVAYNPNHAKAHFMAGKSIMLTIDKHEALGHFLKSAELDPNVDEEVFYYIGMAYHHSHEFDKAIEYYQLHRKKLIRSLDFNRSKQINQVDRKIFECRNAKIYEAHPIDVKISNITGNINSEHPDYAPTVTADESVMVFTSRREDNVNPDVADDHEYYEEVFISRSVNGEFQEATNIGHPINTNFHNASISISPDGSELFLYSSINGGDIYESDLQDDGSWSRPAPIPGEVNTDYLENSASVTADLQTLYFTSNKPGGYGGTDIYVSRMGRNKNWGPPENLGPVVNSEMDEDGVFISADGKHLYFSSNGHAGMGDLDIYRSERDENGEWTKPINLGVPINTPENDIYFTLSGDEKHAYYSSVRGDTKGEQDIYKVDMTNFEPIRLEEIIHREEQRDPILLIPDSSLVNVEMTVLNREDDSPLDALVTITKKSNGVNYLPEQVDNGKYKTQFYVSKADKYEVTVSHDEFDTYTYPIYIMGKGDAETTISEIVRLGRASTSNINLINVYFAHDSDVPSGFEGVQYLEMMMKEEANLNVEISGHTDNNGDPVYNKDLSLRRANAVKDYLVKSGISAERITTVGHGEEKPVASNETSVGRRLNRRTEFAVKGKMEGEVDAIR